MKCDLHVRNNCEPN